MQLEVHVSARSSWGHWSIFFTHLQMTMGSRCMNRQNNLIFNNLSDSNGSLLVHASWIQTELRIGTHRLARIQSGTRATTISKGRDQTIQWMNPSWNRFCSLLTLIQLQREDVRITVGPWIKNLHLCMDNSRITKCNAVVWYMQEMSQETRSAFVPSTWAHEVWTRQIVSRIAGKFRARNVFTIKSLVDMVNELDNCTAKWCKKGDIRLWSSEITPKYEKIKDITKLRYFRFTEGNGDASCTSSRSVLRELRSREDKSELEPREYELLPLKQAKLDDLQKQYRWIDDESRLEALPPPPWAFVIE